MQLHIAPEYDILFIKPHDIAAIYVNTQYETCIVQTVDGRYATTAMDEIAIRQFLSILQFHRSGSTRPFVHGATRQTVLFVEYKLHSPSYA